MSNKKGAALVSILALTSLALAVISSTTIISVVNAKINQSQFWSQKAYQGANCLLDEVIVKFERERSLDNAYPVWTDNCLQINGFDCKMDMNLTEDGGVVDVWGKYKNKQRHMKAIISVDEQQRVSAGKEEIY